MPRYAVDSFRPGLIPPPSLPTSEDTIDRIAEGIAIGLREHQALSEAFARNVAAGKSVLASLQSFASHAWDAPPDVLLQTVVWVRDERGRIVAVGSYRYTGHSSEPPVLEVLTDGPVYRFQKTEDGEGFRRVQYQVDPCPV